MSYQLYKYSEKKANQAWRKANILYPEKTNLNSMLNINTILIAPRLVIQQYNKGIAKYKVKRNFTLSLFLLW